MTYKTLADVPNKLKQVVIDTRGEFSNLIGFVYTEAEFNRALDLMRGMPDEWPDGAEYRAQNAGGKWWHYSRKPHDREGCWFGGGNCTNSIQGTVIGDWRTTLRKRPESQLSGNAEQVGNKYQRNIKGVMVDVYDLLEAFDPDNRNAADDHAIKKMLLPGKRGVKDAIQDRKEAIASLKRSIEILEANQ